MSSKVLGGTAFAQIPTFTMQVPKDGPKAVPLDVDFSGFETFIVDLLQYHNAGRIDAVQSLYFDNSYMDESVLIIPDQGNQVIQIPGRTQGYVNVFISDNFKLEFYSLGSSIFKASLMNVPVYPDRWNSTLTP